MRLSKGILEDVIHTLSFAIDYCEWEEHSETKGELMASRAHAEVALNMLNDPSLDHHYGYDYTETEIEIECNWERRERDEG